MLRSSALLLACVIPHRAHAQATTSLLPNATTLPSHEWRMRLLTAWTRYDALLTDSSSSPVNVAATFNADSLGSAQLPILAPAEAAIRSLTGDPQVRLTAGRLVAAANSRVVTAPLILEYGLTRRITLGLVVPLVETRTTLYAQLNPHAGFANVGPNPTALGNGAAAAQNQALLAAIRADSSALWNQLEGCRATPSGTNCTAILAQGPSVLQSAGAFASTVTSLYGTAAGGGQAFVPLKGTALDTAIAHHIADLGQQFNALINQGIDPSLGPANANGPAANAQLNALLGQMGVDTLQSTDRSSIGDISVGATIQLLNTFPDSAPVDAGGSAIRLAVNGAFRFGTGEPSNRNRLFDLSTGYGQSGVVAGAAADVRLGSRLTTSILGSYTAQFGTVNVGRVPNANNAIFPLRAATPGTYSAGNVLQLTALPHFRLAGYLSIDGVYSLLNVGADKFTVLPAPGADSTAAATIPPVAPYGMPSTTAQQVGFGISYSSIVSPDRAPGGLPIEVSFQHLETLAGSGGFVPKTFRDQIELRIYFRR
ncbi:MAG TPA: hypothetical protein VHB25_09830 [Gemmatimonadaceae bacterium]|nr:hypothetical protein [Gemmatimonadaceae bacterium]